MTPTMIFAISMFTYFSGIGFLFSLVSSFKAERAYKMLSMAAGYDLQKIASSSSDASKSMKFLLMDFTSQMLGLNLFALLILWIPFRNGELWTWVVLWFYPIMFGWHYFHYERGTMFSTAQIVYGILSSLALILAISNFR